MTAARDAWTPELEREMLEAIARTPLLVPTSVDASTGQPGVTLSLDALGDRVAIAFTSLAELGRWAGDTPIDVGRVIGRDLASVAATGRATAMFIDPASDHGGRLAADRIAVVAGDEAPPFDLGVQVWSPPDPDAGA